VDTTIDEELALSLSAAKEKEKLKYQITLKSLL
jgi:hypothetical protein